LKFAFEGDTYELIRQAIPAVKPPASDLDYRIERMLIRNGVMLGPQEIDRALAQVFPEDISRFFLFDGELLQEYEELIISESDVGPKISGAIERILGVPIVKAGSREADGGGSGSPRGHSQDRRRAGDGAEVA
jgi:DNA sulfur modification protein DndD